MSTAPSDALERAKRVRLMAFDVDGVLTDGRLWYGPQGETLKAFSARDGLGMRMLADAGVSLALLTSRQSGAVVLRAAELGIEHVLQGSQDKQARFAALLAQLGLDSARVGYMGDDLVDLPVLRRCGFACAPPGAAALVQQHVHYVASAPAGAGAVREVCELVLRAQGKLEGARRVLGMTFSATRLFPLLLMLALALLTFWLERTVRDEEPHPSQRRHDPDYVVEKFVVTKFNAAGALESTLSAVEMVHYPDDDSTELVAPRVVQAKANEPRMTLSADRGALSQNGEELFLFGNALLVREAGGGRAEARMQSSFLHVIGARSLVRTDREVQVLESGRTLSGRGMEYHNETWQLFLRDQVRGRFEPAKRKPSSR